MRLENITMTLRIPIAYGKPDANGNIYTREAIESAVKNLKEDVPFLIDEKVIGSVDNVRLYEDNMLVNVKLLCGGGTRCVVKDMEVVDSKIVIKDYDIISFGIGD